MALAPYRFYGLNHGEGSAAYRAGCRCDVCRHATNYSRRIRRHVGAVKTHSLNGYKNGCRCPICKAAGRNRAAA